MKRLTVAALVLGIVLVPLTWSVVAARPQVNQPGMPTVARVYILNKELTEAIPVRMLAGGVAQPVTVTTPVTLASGTAVGMHTLRQVWEYRQMTVSPSADGMAALNTAGADGWEAVAMTSAGANGSVVILKRVR
jgi:hypothetical protein